MEGDPQGQEVGDLFTQMTNVMNVEEEVIMLMTAPEEGDPIEVPEDQGKLSWIKYSM